MLREIKIKNYRSIRDASIKLSPFTLLIGANGTGKSNLLKLLKDISNPSSHTSTTKSGLSLRTTFEYENLTTQKHFAHDQLLQEIEIISDQGTFEITNGSSTSVNTIDITTGTTGRTSRNLDIRVFSLVPQNAGNNESIVLEPTIEEGGEGLVRVLDSLKTGDREDLFNKIEAIFREHIPEIEKLSFLPANSAKQLQVREKHLPRPVKVSELSEGTQLALQIITILHQERKPSLICIEDIDKGLHPRLFQKIVQLCFDLTAEDDSIQIIATTHNPYLVDEFKGHESAVVIVEKTNGETTFTTLEDKLQNLDPGEEPLGSLWYSGFVGGVPQGV